MMPSSAPAAETYRPPARTRPPKQPPTRRPGRWGRRIKIALALVVIALIGWGVYLDQNLNRVQALPADSTAESSGTNWLIVGSDSRADLSAEDEERLGTGDAAGQRTDTIMLLHSGSSGSVLVSLPRDSYVPIAGHGSNKLNAAYAFGGPQLLISTVEAATGLHIDHYAEIGFGGFVDAVDAVGGVNLCVPKAITDPKAALDIQAGCQELDGQTALGYVRTRATAGSDFDRVQRQREFLSALIAKATSVGTLVNPFRVIPLADAMTGLVTVDDNDHIWNVAQLGLAMRGVTNGGIATTAPVGSTPTIGGQSVVRWDKTRASALFGSLQKDQTPAQSSLGP
ncbi:LCP family protein [Pseudonocardia kujensis]|uniref:LCP family protein n=1 Tax=Pseudonocardia kujensis TaxID=1128675 RepID=UPI001E5F39E5|nr:LCP family protein [Pseudonocardia kujensis]MCE0761658.1 LCP family protein [Pseudonocardia kujensis]